MVLQVYPESKLFSENINIDLGIKRYVNSFFCQNMKTYMKIVISSNGGILRLGLLDLCTFSWYSEHNTVAVFRSFHLTQLHRVFPIFLSEDGKIHVFINQRFENVQKPYNSNFIELHHSREAGSCWDTHKITSISCNLKVQYCPFLSWGRWIQWLYSNSVSIDLFQYYLPMYV
jgi:hypothetical protein